MSDKTLSFKIKSGLKNIIGRDLITDDYVAVFELVKNSFDAYAKKVVITFFSDKIIITDDGKGMDLKDINDKWLAVAYSAKKDGVEDDDLDEKEFDSYRNKIQSKKFFAGAKGIGRFSCDRLGNKLMLTSKKAYVNAEIEQIEVDWSDFEKDSKDEFIDIKVKHRTLQPITKKLKQFQNGTILEISQLNSNWDRTKKQNLKYSLEKLINPFEDNPLNGFSIIIEDDSEIEKDNTEKNKRDKINGEVKNFVFETLGLKTTQILTEIDSKGEFITTSLWDRDTLIYKIRRKNNTIPKLENLKIHLFHLNRSAKNNFSRIMGIAPVNFGSIFVYKNGFRIPPYGDYGFDYFGIDSRKIQKHFDRFGSRDLIGRIEIMGGNPNFKEISSRDGGLVRNEYYNTLVRFFISNTLLKLENYANDVLFTNREDKDKDDLSALNNITAKSALLNLITSEVDDVEVELLDVDKENLNIRTQELLQTATTEDIQALKIIADKLGDRIFAKEADKTERELQKILLLQIKLAEEEEARQKAEEEKRKLVEQLEDEKKKNTFLLATSKNLDREALGLFHHIHHETPKIDGEIDVLITKINNDDIKKKEILNRLFKVKLYTNKISTIGKLITRSNFNEQAKKQKLNLAEYIAQYMGAYKEINSNTELSIIVKNNATTFNTKISAIEVAIVFDNLIHNSFKANAKKVLVQIENAKDKLVIFFSDDGKGILNRFKDNPEIIFDLGITSTDGSGIGLYTARDLLTKMKGSIEYVKDNNILKGATFKITFTQDA